MSTAVDVIHRPLAGDHPLRSRDQKAAAQREHALSVHRLAHVRLAGRQHGQLHLRNLETVDLVELEEPVVGGFV